MSIHRLSAGSGYQYLLRHTASGDVQRLAGTPLTAYYAASGYPPGRWAGAGISGLGAPSGREDGAPDQTAVLAAEAAPLPRAVGGHAERRDAAPLASAPASVASAASPLASGIAAGSAVSEEQMARLYGRGEHPVTGEPIGSRYRIYRPVEERVADRVAQLPADLPEDERAVAVERIETDERRRGTPAAVAGFDLTFTMPKSASVLWALADPRLQARIAEAHRQTVEDVLRVIETDALFTRTGHNGVAQVATRGAIAACFDHWDTRAGDPNLHTHLVIANKVQGDDGQWRSVDSRALHHAAVAMSELYDDLIADRLAQVAGVRWGWRDRGPRRTPAFEVDGIDDPLLAEFSHRSAHIETRARQLVADHRERTGRSPDRPEMLRLRQQATLDTRPDKTLRPLAELIADWRRRAAAHGPLAALLRRTLQATDTTESTERPTGHTTATCTVAVADLSEPQLQELATTTLAGLQDRRSTWTAWNVRAEAARATRGLRTATTTDRLQLLDELTGRVLDQLSVPLDPPAVFTPPARWQRPDGASAFTRHHEAAYSSTALLDAEARLLAAADDRTSPRAPLVTTPTTPPTAAAATPTATSCDVTAAQSTSGVRRDPPERRAHSHTSATASSTSERLHEDQAAAVAAILSSGRRLDVLVGPAGAGKTRTLRAIRHAWEAEHGPASVVGLAPSATAAHELGAAVGIACETVAKWQHDTGPADTGATGRPALASGVAGRASAKPPRANGAAATTSAVASADAATPQAGNQSATPGSRPTGWRLRAGQLVIVDEASLAATLTLDQLTSAATAAGAKLLLVGDHHQLGAINAGGAFGLLARATHAAELTLLWRFRNRWEAHASRALRRGDPAALDAYTAHQRIHDGPAEAMLEDAYQAWRQARGSGQHSVLIAADQHTVTALNLRAQTDQHTDTDQHGDGKRPFVRLHDDTCAWAGDTVVTRRNDRRLRTAGGRWVRNGDLWTIQHVHPDGSATLTPALRQTTRDTSRPTGHGPDGPADSIRLPASYVRDHVELGYAFTAHRAQGLTTDESYVLVRPGISREALYVAMTRGRAANHAYVATDLPDDDHLSPPPAEPRPTSGRQILAAALARTDADISATETLRTRRDDAASLATLVPIYETIAHTADRDRWTRLLRDTDLDPTTVTAVLDSPGYGALVAALRRAEQAGTTTDDLLRLVVDTARSTSDTAAVVDPALAAHGRLAADTCADPADSGEDPAHLIAGLLGAAAPTDDPTISDSLRELEQLITRRTRTLAVQTLRTPPGWAPPLGPPPREHQARRHWLDAIGVVAGYRDLHQIDQTEDNLLGPADTAIGPATDERRRATAAALAAVRLARAARSTTSTRNADLGRDPHTDRSIRR